LEIEERLVQHASISQASVVGIQEPKYGEVVGVFLQQRSKVPRPSNEELREFVRQTLGRHKVPVHIFWLEVGEAFPQTGSGKIKKHILREHGAKLVLSSNAGFH
jgi:long-chain acyl-CoA synthetase